MKYRAEIDGLRALAVVPVILFHAGFELFSGGFVGVDVFFVISGYLITTILIEDIENQRYSIVNFYERRARRILPALFLVMLACIPFAWLWMIPSQMQAFSQSLAAVSLFVSNFLFWRQSGYFETAAEEKPLLHTWSLAVEEQYYVLFPIYLLLAWRFGRSRVFWMVVVMAVISFALSEWGWRNRAAANFYLAPTRVWELFAGSVTAFILQKHEVKANNWLAMIGLAAILFAVFAYNETTPFPSVYTLIPVLGVVLLILFAARETLAARLLSVRWVVGIGLISYSAYLWHQPLFAFARIRLTNEPTPILMLSLSLVAIGLAFLSWRFVERPFRDKAVTSRRMIFSFSIIGTLMFVALGLFGHAAKGFGKQSSMAITATLPQDIVVLGDSHASHLLKGFRQVTTGKVTNGTDAGCLPFRHVDRYDARITPGTCVKAMAGFLDATLQLDKEALVVLSAMGPVYLDGTPFKGKDEARVTGQGVVLVTDKSITNPYDVFEIGLRNTLTELTRKPNLDIVFAIDIPELGIDWGCGEERKTINLLGYELTDLTQYISLAPEHCHVTRSDYDARVRAYKALVAKVLGDFPTVAVFDPTDYFCDETICEGYIEGIGYLYRDVDHLSYEGSLFYAEKFADWYLAQKRRSAGAR